MILPELFANRPSPVSREQASTIAAQFGVRGALIPLASERDQNIRIDVSGGPSYVLKITNPAEPASVTGFETDVLEHLAVTAEHLPVPRLVRTLTGALALRWPVAGVERTVRLFTYLPGTPLANAAASTALRRSIGATLAALDAALCSVSHHERTRDLLWDFSQASALRRLLARLADASLRKRLELALDRLEAQQISRRPEIRPQWLHNDFNPYNVLVSAADATRVCGVVDFGDMAYGPLVCDLAVACAYAMRGAAPLGAIADVVEGFHAHTALSDAELDLLPLLIDARFAMTVLITEWRAGLNSTNSAYILRNNPAAHAGLTVIEENSPSAVSAFLRERLFKSIRHP